MALIKSSKCGNDISDRTIRKKFFSSVKFKIFIICFLLLSVCFGIAYGVFFSHNRSYNTGENKLVPSDKSSSETENYAADNANTILKLSTLNDLDKMPDTNSVLYLFAKSDYGMTQAQVSDMFKDKPSKGGFYKNEKFYSNWIYEDLPYSLNGINAKISFSFDADTLLSSVTWFYKSDHATPEQYDLLRNYISSYLGTPSKVSDDSSDAFISKNADWNDCSLSYDNTNGNTIEFRKSTPYIE